MKQLWIVALLLTSALIAGQGNMMPSYGNFDGNGDGKITQTEFEDAQQARMIKQAEAGKMMRNAANAPTFADIDTNKDGIIDTNEFQIHQASHQRGSGMGQGKGMGNGQGMNR
jgi:hypothetical protein